ncbi:sensor histidine kinase [Aestuariivivens insulae]|uniref:sensor histidine kinase n=1 Tax=Aestuariivivens insulae TaxID=1621988 RepID=UPI001F583F33|nr:histidine kinase [Aestuariivivens insulae]
MKFNLSIKFIIHFLFWAFYIFVVFYLGPTHGKHMGWHHTIDFRLLSLVLGVTYFNDLFLLPKLFNSKKYLYYALAITALLFIATIFYCYKIVECSCSYTICLSDNFWKILLPIVFLSFIWVLLRLFDHQKELEKTNKERLEMELKYLKSQINPHVLFNNLNTIYAEALKNEDDVAEMILKLSENLKYVLYQSDSNLVGLEKEVDFIDNYLEFEQLRTQGINRITYTKNIDSFNYNIAPLLLIGLVENAFKHGKFKEDDLCDITITLSVKDGLLHFICKNECNPLKSSIKTDKNSQIGLVNLRKRLDLIYKDKYEFTTSQEDDVFIANLKIELL